ncbi:MAG TPA: nucleoside triphosphate pyrophosphohydrolase family protein [Candidatus Rubrimentiphilum sp.]|nr:nucleoside triphosphate pyrophosphohydrolase family protein [Candidatus Rubrimentiphilum sp.]
MLPLLGLAGEAATLLTAYKKYLRDGDAYLLYKEEIAEELGDTLWYLSTLASHYGLALGEIARDNLAKTTARFMPHVTLKNFDAGYPLTEQFPREFEALLVEDSGSVSLFRAQDGRQIGDPLTNNAYDDDGYRWHDALHLAFVAVLGWSPTIRGLLRLKRKSNPTVDEVEDGGRAIVIDEAITAFAFEYARGHNMLAGANAVDYSVLRTIKMLTSRLEVAERTAHDWERTLLTGFGVFRQVRDAGGGKLLLNLDNRTIRFESLSESSWPKQ